jgi:hypothetical protein
MSNHKKNKPTSTPIIDCSGQMELPLRDLVISIDAASVSVGTSAFTNSQFTSGERSESFATATVHEFRRSSATRQQSPSTEALRRILDFARTLPGR